MTPGEIIRERRRQLGLTQAQLAERVGHIDSSAISNIERGNIGLGHERALRFAGALGLDPRKLDGEPAGERPTLRTVLDRLEEHEAHGFEWSREIVRALELLAAQVAALDDRLERTAAPKRKARAR